jgi:hypothetical protein
VAAKLRRGDTGILEPLAQFGFELFPDRPVDFSPHLQGFFEKPELKAHPD